MSEAGIHWFLNIAFRNDIDYFCFFQLKRSSNKIHQNYCNFQNHRKPKLNCVQQLYDM